jgi:hypothetical protein
VAGGGAHQKVRTTEADPSHTRRRIWSGGGSG